MKCISSIMVVMATFAAPATACDTVISSFGGHCYQQAAFAVPYVNTLQFQAVCPTVYAQSYYPTVAVNSYAVQSFAHPVIVRQRNVIVQQNVVRQKNIIVQQNVRQRNVVQQNVVVRQNVNVRNVVQQRSVINQRTVVRTRTSIR